MAPVSAEPEALSQSFCAELYDAFGTLHYTSPPRLKVVLEIDSAIADYYRSLIPKYIKVNKPLYEPHISVVRKELPPQMQHWGKYEGEKVPFAYSGIIHVGKVYCWLNAFSTRLEAIRAELGLPVHSHFTLPPEGFAHCFHITVGNRKHV